MGNIKLQVLPDYQLKLCFPNGSQAIVNMENRLQGIRFGRLSRKDTFSSAKIQGNEVIWRDGNFSIRATVDELLDSMQME